MPKHIYFALSHAYADYRTVDCRTPILESKTSMNKFLRH